MAKDIRVTRENPESDKPPDGEKGACGCGCIQPVSEK